MNMIVKEASMTYTKESGYIGKIRFEVEHHQKPYEINVQRKKQEDWGYSLFFWREPGPEEEIGEVDEYLEEDDAALNRLVQAAMDTYNPDKSAE